MAFKTHFIERKLRVRLVQIVELSITQDQQPLQHGKAHASPASDERTRLMAGADGSLASDGLAYVMGDCQNDRQRSSLCAYVCTKPRRATAYDFARALVKRRAAGEERAECECIPSSTVHEEELRRRRGGGEKY